MSPGLSPAGSFGGYLFDSHAERSSRSPSFPTMLGRQDTWNMGYDGQDRRPSVASTTTMSSVGSGRSYSRVATHKKLHGFFGEEPPSEDNHRFSEAPSFGSVMSNGDLVSRPRYSRHGSFKSGFENHFGTGSFTPESVRTTRPKTPQPSADVTPWLFQEHAVSYFAIE